MHISELESVRQRFECIDVRAVQKLTPFMHLFATFKGFLTSARNGNFHKSDSNVREEKRVNKIFCENIGHTPVQTKNIYIYR